MLKTTNVFNCTVHNGKIEFLEEEDRKKRQPEDEVLMEACDYHKKNFTYTHLPKQLAKAFNFWLEVPDDKFEELHDAVEVSLMATFMMGDLIVDRDLREGKATAHRIYGKPQVMNTFFYCGMAIASIDDIDIMKCTEILSEKGLEGCRLVSVHSTLVDECICPDEETYFKSCKSKSYLAMLPVELILLQELYCKQSKFNFTRLIESIQDFCSLITSCKSIVKGDPMEIQVGFFSLPIIYAIKSSEDNGRILLNILRQKTSDKALLNHALLLVVKSGSIDYCKTKLHKLREQILSECKKLKTNPLMDEFLDKYIVVPDDLEEIAWPDI